ncbi:MAG: metallophosphoesterase [Clostridia bacterium]|nr:metallophosphoesterase [Clostridia bacterium]
MKKLIAGITSFVMALSLFSFLPSVSYTSAYAEQSIVQIVASKVKPTSAGDGYNFNGEQYFVVGDELDQVPLTIETWVYLPANWDTSKRPGSLLSSYAGNTNSPYFHFDLYSVSGHISPRFEYKDVLNTKVNSALAINFDTVEIKPGEWTHITIVSDPLHSAATCYKNGVLAETDYISGANTNSQWVTFDDRATDYPIAVGGDIRPGLEQTFKGSLYNMSLFSSQRTAQEIANDYANGVDANAESLLAHWNLDVNVGENVLDASANGIDLTYNKVWLDNGTTTPSDYDYTFAFVPDIQYLTENDTEYDTKQVERLYKWIADNAESQKIEFVAGLGDVTNYDLPSEWKVAYDAISQLNGVTNYSVINGNHDYGDPNKTVSYTKGDVTVTENKLGGTGINDYFGKDAQYTAQFTSSNGGGTFATNDYKNTYKKLTVGNNKWMFVNLDWDPSDEVLIWANKIVSANKDHKVVITLHNYMHGDGMLTDAERTSSAITNNTGVDVWNKFASLHENIKMVVSGHQEFNFITMTQSKGIHGNTVSQFLIDAQMIDSALMHALDPKDTAAADNDTFGWGEVDGIAAVALFRFSNGGSEVDVEYYSVTQEKYFYSANQFTFDLDADKDETNYVWGGAEVKPNGRGTESDPYIINHPGHLLWMADEIKKGDLSGSTPKDVTFDGVYFKQDADIDLQGMAIQSIGAYYSANSKQMSAFGGTYDGNGYSIKNGRVVPFLPRSASNGLLGHGTNRNWTDGLFGCIYGATIKNLTLDNLDIYSRGVTGGLVGRAIADEDGLATSDFNVIEGCRLTDSVKIYTTISNRKTISGGEFDGYYHIGVVGSIVGTAYATTIRGCTSAVEIEVDGNHTIVGGIAGNAGYNSVIENCSFTGGITLTEDVTLYDGAFGGIVGLVSPSASTTNGGKAEDNMEGNLVIKNSYNSGYFKYTGNKALTKNVYWGGIVGHARTMFDINKDKYPFLVENCYNLYAKETESVLANSDKYFAGGIVGYVLTGEYAEEDNIWLKDCYSVDIEEKGGEGTNEYRHNSNITLYGKNGVEVIENVGTTSAEEMTAQIKKIIIDTAYIQSGSKVANKWYTGEGAPTVSAFPGDMYLDSETNDVYQFVNGWEKICNIKGETGDNGVDGEDGKPGVDGQPGLNGSDGNKWFTGTELPTADMKENDFFLNTETYDLYQYKNSVWEKIGNIKGATGEQGPQGPQGEIGETGAKGAAGCAQNAMSVFGLVAGLCAIAFAFKKFTR